MILVLLREEPKETVNAVRGKPGLAFFTVVAIGQILPRRANVLNEVQRLTEVLD